LSRAISSTRHARARALSYGLCQGVFTVSEVPPPPARTTILRVARFPTGARPGPSSIETISRLKLQFGRTSDCLSRCF
jgi:hypothetical protein